MTRRRKNWGMTRQDDETEAGSESTEWPDAAEESHAALPEVMTPVAWEFLAPTPGDGRVGGAVKRVGESALRLLCSSCG